MDGIHAGACRSRRCGRRDSSAGSESGESGRSGQNEPGSRVQAGSGREPAAFPEAGDVTDVGIGLAPRTRAGTGRERRPGSSICTSQQRILDRWCTGDGRRERQRARPAWPRSCGAAAEDRRVPGGTCAGRAGRHALNAFVPLVLKLPSRRAVVSLVPSHGPEPARALRSPQVGHVEDQPRPGPWTGEARNCNRPSARPRVPSCKHRQASPAMPCRDPTLPRAGRSRRCVNSLQSDCLWGARGPL